MNYYEIDFSYESDLDANIISDILASELGEIGFESFTKESNGLQAFVPEDKYSDSLIKERIESFPLDGVSFCYQTKYVESKDWNEEWEKNYFKPIRIGKECIIRASFHKDEPGYKYDIIIDPKMAFGTGNHATTYLMIQQMLQLNLEGKELLDMGCGTAVLAILAKKHGAERVVGIDIDEWAYNNAKENIRLNSTEDIEIVLGGAERIEEYGMFDIVFANINRNILLNDIRFYSKSMKPGAMLFMSGFYKDDVPAIKRACKLNGLIPDSFTERDGWCAIKSHKQ